MVRWYTWPGNSWDKGKGGYKGKGKGLNQIDYQQAFVPQPQPINAAYNHQGDGLMATNRSNQEGNAAGHWYGRGGLNLMCLKPENKYVALQRGDGDEEDGHEVESNPRDYTIGEVIRSAFHRKGLQAKIRTKRSSRRRAHRC